MVLLAGYVGLRAGEVGGLWVLDLDTAQFRITVAQAVVWTREWPSYRAPQDRLVPQDADHPVEPRDRTRGVRHGSGLVFTTQIGGLVDAVILTKMVLSSMGDSNLRATIQVYGHLFDQGGARWPRAWKRGDRTGRSGSGRYPMLELDKAIRTSSMSL
jgi:hypothetical protein